MNAPVQFGKVALRGSIVTGISQVVKIGLQFLSVIVLARLLAPEDFGLVAAVGPIVAFVALFQNLGLQQAVVQRPDISDQQLNRMFWVMAGLACGEPSLLAWQELHRAAAAFMAIPDESAEDTMRLLADIGIVGGESGVAGLAGALLAAADPAARATLGLDAHSRVLAFCTEGATDPELYETITGRPAESLTSRQS